MGGGGETGTEMVLNDTPLGIIWRLSLLYYYFFTFYFATLSFFVVSDIWMGRGSVGDWDDG